MGLARKAFLKLVGFNPVIDRLVRYRNPRNYWRQRGGDRYFQEQEAVYDRTLRSEFIAEHVKKLDYRSLLEIGCGYGKQLRNFKKSEDNLIAGIDFSRPQLLKARELCPNLSAFYIEADAETIPLKTKSFDAVLSSAVILHNEYEKARKILSEMIRISRRFLIHNEDTDITFSRYGYDMKKTYERLGFRILESKEIPSAPDPAKTQFTIIELPSLNFRVKAEEIPLQYH